MSTLQRWAYIGLSIFGLGFIIFFHELGHFLACKLFDIATPVFSIGFPPSIASIQIGQTSFELGAIPLGGYVSIDPTDMAHAPYWVKMTVILAGVMFNFLLSFLIVAGLKRHMQTSPHPLRTPTIHEGRRVVGIIGIIHMLRTSLATDPRLYFLVLARVSTSVGLFNLLPLPYLDGSQLFRYTMEYLDTRSQQGHGMGFIESMLLIILIILALLFLFGKRRQAR